MQMVEIKEISYKSYGRAVQISNGTIELVATLDLGPRIIRFGFVGGDNILYEDGEDRVTSEGNDGSIYGDKGKWHLYGGHRLWTSPEISPRTYYPDNERVEYERIQDGIKLMPPPQAVNNVRLEMEVTILGEHRVKVLHRITNEGLWEVELAPWALTVLKQNGLEVIPHTTRKTGFLGNRLLALWDYTDMADERVYWGKDFITLRQNPDSKAPFKLGTTNEKGYALYFVDGQLFLKRFDTVVEGYYPDGGMSFETYTSPDILEMETLGELTLLAHGESVEHIEQWELLQGVDAPGNDEEKIHEIVKRYL